MMKNAFFSLLLVELFCVGAMANPGDTTWVTVFNQRKLTYHGNYDTTASFPLNKRYRKIRLHYIIGRYACPPTTVTPAYCGSWDYTTQIFSLRKGRDTVEIARVITPYASDWLSQNKKHDFIVDVTDYNTVLDTITTIRYRYDGYSWGFTLTMKLELIEGVPPMDAMSVKNIYNGYFAYGNSANPIETYLLPKTFIYPTTTKRVFVRNTVSGHGADATGCSEFCNKYYNLKVDGTSAAQRQLWRTDCAVNHVYPQTGTWPFSRGNWCPGAVVLPIFHELTDLTIPNASFTVDVDMQPYATGSPSGGYNWVSHLIQYKAPNHSLDASLEDIVAPSSNENYFRNNPICSNPIVKIKNTGTDSVYTVVFNYGLRGHSSASYTWTGALGFLQEKEVVFPISTSLINTATSSNFDVFITNVNGTVDENQQNNSYTSVTKPAVVFPPAFVVKTLTNKSTNGATLKNQTTWAIYDEFGSTVMTRTGMANNTAYSDTVMLVRGCYKFAIEDAGCDGYAWWYYQYYNPNPGNGTMRLDYINANNSFYNFQGDFGCNMYTYFMVDPDYVGISPQTNRHDEIEVFPNPAEGLAYIKFDLNRTQPIKYRLSDISGKIILEKSIENVSASYEAIDVTLLSAGVYFVSVELQDKSNMVKKLIVQR